MKSQFIRSCHLPFTDINVLCHHTSVTDHLCNYRGEYFDYCLFLSLRPSSLCEELNQMFLYFSTTPPFYVSRHGPSRGRLFRQWDTTPFPPTPMYVSPSHFSHLELRIWLTLPFRTWDPSPPVSSPTLSSSLVFEPLGTGKPGGHVYTPPLSHHYH